MRLFIFLALVLGFLTKEGQGYYNLWENALEGHFGDTISADIARYNGNCVAAECKTEADEDVCYEVSQQNMTFYPSACDVRIFQKADDSFLGSGSLAFKTGWNKNDRTVISAR
jgi:hypothetical protein